jgi:hypothetical protein
MRRKNPGGDDILAGDEIYTMEPQPFQKTGQALRSRENRKNNSSFKIQNSKFT